jgi:hypothetical protein
VVAEEERPSLSQQAILHLLVAFPLLKAAWPLVTTQASHGIDTARYCIDRAFLVPEKDGKKPLGARRHTAWLAY